MSLNLEASKRFCYTFSNCLRGGLSFSSGLTLLKEQGFSKRVVEQLEEELTDKAKLFGEGIQNVRLLEPTICRAIIAAEKSGHLSEYFQELYFRYENRLLVTKKIFKDSSGTILTLSLIFPLYGVLNSFSDFAMDDIWEKVSHGLTIGAVQSGLFLALFYLFYLLWLDLSITSLIHRVTKGILNIIPGISGVFKLYRLAEFCQFFGRSLHAGLSIYDAVDLSLEGSLGSSQEAYIQSICDKLRSGLSLVQSLKDVDFIPEELLSQIAIAEKSGTLEETFELAAERYRREGEERIKLVIERANLIFMCVGLGLFFYIFLQQLMGLLEEFSALIS